MDIAVLANHIVKLKDNKKMEWYLDFTREKHKQTRRVEPVGGSNYMVSSNKYLSLVNSDK